MSARCIQVISYYNRKGLVGHLHADRKPEEVTAEVHKALD